MKKIKLFILAFVLSLSSLAVLAPQTYAATRTWTGGGGNTNMSTVGNWGGTAPVAGDDLVFPANITNRTVVNDLTAATSFNSITFSGTATAASTYTLSGNSITLAGNITDSMTGAFSYGHTISFPVIVSGDRTITTPADTYFTIGGALSGTGGLTKVGNGALLLTGTNSSYTGSFTATAGDLVARNATALGTSAGSTTISGTGALYLAFQGAATIDEPLHLTGENSLAISTGYGSGGASTVPYDLITLSGALTLGSNLKVSLYDHNLKLTGTCTGAYTTTLSQGSNGTLEAAFSSNGCSTANGVVEASEYTTAYDGNVPLEAISVGFKEIAVVKGTYGEVYVGSGGTLKGTGTVGNVTTVDGSTVAPGLSPGCLNTGNITLVAGTTYQAEVGGAEACTGYDQLNVTGTVDITDATLTTSLYDSFKPTAGATYTIIDNDGTDAVTGTFADLAEGATFTVDGTVFKISYIGGDGNDVVLTVVSVPATPDTGFALISSNPIASMSVVLLAAVAIAIAARRTTAKSTVRSRR